MYKYSVYRKRDMYCALQSRTQTPSINCHDPFISLPISLSNCNGKFYANASQTNIHDRRTINHPCNYDVE